MTDPVVPTDYTQATRRPNYFDGRLITAADLRQDQEYHRGMRYLQNRALGGASSRVSMSAPPLRASRSAPASRSTSSVASSSSPSRSSWPLTIRSSSPAPIRS